MKKDNFFQYSYKDEPPKDVLDETFVDEKLRNSENVFSKQKNKNSKRLNAYDTQLLEETAAPIQPELLNPKEKLRSLEEKLQQIDEKISFATMTENHSLVQDLQHERYKLVHQIEQVKNIPQKYESNTLYSKIVSFFVQILKGVKRKKRSFKKIYQSHFLTKILRPLMRSQQLREVITTLNTLNQNVNELSQLRIPYGEHEARYEELTKYITQATSIQALIKKDIDSKNKK